VEVVADPLHRRGEVGFVWHAHTDADISDMMKAVRIKPEAGISSRDHTAINSRPLTGGTGLRIRDCNLVENAAP
jgi:hypothetical protein